MRMMSIDLERQSATIKARVALHDRDKPLEALSEFDFDWTQQDQEDLRWYLEDYLIYPVDPAPTVAGRVVRRIEAVGKELFTKLFRNNPNASLLWESAAQHLPDLFIELRSAERHISVLPWELIREPASDSVLAISCRSFVRVHSAPSRSLVAPPAADELIRMLLVICRPAGAADVPFRSVASRLLKGMQGGLDRSVQVDVLRPPTYGQLSSVVRKAALAGKPYHIVHFDGHGLPGGLVFENPATEQNREIIQGRHLGELLADAKIPLLVLNACRSAFAEPPAGPIDASNLHEDIRVFGSLAQTVADQGLPCVLAMRFNVFVETAARFMLNFYSALVGAATVGEAVQGARAQLRDEPLRQSVPHDVPLEDWIVPLVFEARPIRLLSSASAQDVARAHAETVDLGDGELPRRPDAGFFGRDETLLALDRAFDSANVVLLHAYAGSGKTATASEFARWYRQTRGTHGPLLFSSFDTKRTLGQLVDQLGRRFERWLAEKGIQWAAIVDPEERRKQALAIFSHSSVFWIWDNVEPIAGFPAGSESQWSAQEQMELADFLRDGSERGAKFLLTSRRDESAWLGMIPSRVTIPPMPFWERTQLSQALSKKMGRPPDYVQDWRPLLDFTQGNPLAITVLVVHALRNRMRTRADIEKFVSQLQSGAANLQDDPVQGRSRSLTASLSYGLEHAFSSVQRKAISLLHFFQGCVNPQILQQMGTGINGLPEVAALDFEGIRQMLDIGVELGILENSGETGSIYRIHPVVPWFFRATFHNEFPGREQSCKRSFAVTVALASAILAKQFRSGASVTTATALQMEEANIRHALKLAIELEAWTPVMATMHALEDLYIEIQGNRAEWRRLIEQVDRLVTDEKTGGSIAGRENAWIAVTEYKMRMANQMGNYVEAEHFAGLQVPYWRRQTAPYLKGKADIKRGYEEIHNLAVALESQASFLSAMGSTEGVKLYEEAFALSLNNGDARQAAMCAQGLGWAYREVEAIHDLQQALGWFTKAFGLTPEDDFAFKGKLMLLIGTVYHAWFENSWGTHPNTETLEHGENAFVAFAQALEWLPEYAYLDRSEAMSSTGALYLRLGDYAKAEETYQDALQLARGAGSLKFEIMILLNIASALNGQGRFADATAFAKAAGQKAEAWGPDGEESGIAALELLARIAAAQRAAQPGRP
jgi:tetratricopeptide (TPR) repeat protein